MHRRSVGGSVIKARRLQRSFGDGLIVAEIKDLQETWMHHADMVLEDDAIISAVHHALEHRHPASRSHGEPDPRSELLSISLKMGLVSATKLSPLRKLWSVGLDIDGCVCGRVVTCKIRCVVIDVCNFYFVMSAAKDEEKWNKPAHVSPPLLRGS
jgi:hypothetical protein